MALTRKTAVGGARTVGGAILKVDYSVPRVRTLIESYGSLFDWYQALVCPCTVKDQQEDRKFTSLTCSLCNGTTWAYKFNSSVRGIASSMSRREETNTYRIPKFGQASNLYTNLTVLPENKINIRDRLIFKEAITFRSEATRYSAATALYKFTWPIIEIQRVIGEDGTVYDHSNVDPTKRDCDSDDDGNFYWVSGNDTPAEGTAFSVLYGFYPRYVVVTIPHEIRGVTAGGTRTSEGHVQAYEDLPRLFTMKLEIPDAYLFE